VEFQPLPTQRPLKAFAAGIGPLLSGRRPSDVPCIAPGSLSAPGGFDATVDWMRGDIGSKALRVHYAPVHTQFTLGAYVAPIEEARKFRMRTSCSPHSAGRRSLLQMVH